MSVTEAGSRDDASLLIRRALLPQRGLFDLRIGGERIVALQRELEPCAGERIIDARGNVLLPGLHDHHLHLFATAAARASLLCGPPAAHEEQSLRQALARHCAQGEGWVRGIGFHESACAQLDRHWLDAVCAERPVRIQHRSGMLWVLNSCALGHLRVAPDECLPAGAERTADGELTGRFFDLDAWLGSRLPRAWPSLRDVSAELARHGITAVTDAGARNGQAAWEALCGASARGELVQRVLVMGNEELAVSAGASPGRIEVGPLKIYLREIGLPEFEALVLRVQAAHAQGRAVAFHCVTRVELTFALAALAQAGTLPGDRMEHAAIADEHALQALAALGVTVVTQPQFIAERGDQYLRDVEAVDIPLLYRGAGFLRGGVALAAGSDAPYGSTDPWAAMRAAIGRRTRAGVQMNAGECLAPAQAIALFAGDLHRPASGLRELAVGQPADLCLLDVSWEDLCADPDARHVALTVCAGRIVYAAPRHA
ncbi:MAG TPA: amidohydrolase family protein [Pseudomonadales bacterium]|nr:amidohydrolase family protein [Pseudomonadales bacterium]